MAPDEAKRIAKAVRDIDAAREVFAEVCAERDRLRALLRECLPAISGHLRDKVMQQLGSE